MRLPAADGLCSAVLLLGNPSKPGFEPEGWWFLTKNAAFLAENRAKSAVLLKDQVNRKSFHLIDFKLVTRGIGFEMKPLQG